MHEKYYNKLENRIDWLLKHSGNTFEEIVRECKGAYPKDVLNILRSKNILQLSDRTILTYNGLDSDYISEYVTGRIDNNPVLCSWYFSLSTCKKIIELSSWENKRILFLGMPRLFEYFVKNITDANYTLLDLDRYVINGLKEQYYNKNCDIIYADINKFNFENNYDYIFLDPPWYMNYYERWIEKAYKMLDKNIGTIIFPLFQELTRPDAEKQRSYLLNKISKCSKNYLLISDLIEYEIPTFERCELQNHGIIFKEPWKKADLIIANGLKSCKFKTSVKKISTYEWQEIDILSVRIFINVNNNDKNENIKIRYFKENGVYLENPSRRNRELNLINMMTSRGQGYIVKAAKKMLNTLQEIKEKIESGMDIKVAIDSYDFDDLSKEILVQILEE